MPDKQTNANQNSVWISLLEPVETSLRALQSSTESQFMQIGGQMARFSQQASLISQKAVAIMELISGQETVQNLNHVLSEVNEVTEFITSRMNQLEQDAAILERQKSNFLKLDRPIENLKKIIVQLYTLSMAIKIENTRLSTDNNEFNLLADEVKTLAQNSKKNIERITDTQKQAHSEMEQIISDIQHFTKDRYVHVTRLIQTVQSDMDNIKQQNSVAASLSEELNAIFTDNYNHINDVIMNLQFHDIVRQKIEHVLHSIEDLKSDLAIDGQPEDGSFAEKMYAFCQLHTEQLKYAHQEVLNALNTIKDRFAQLNSGLSFAAERLTDISDMFSVNLQNALQQTGRNIEHISESIRQTIHSGREAAETISVVVDVLNRISGFVKEINTVGEDISLISFNGLIQAAHLGNEGIALGAVTGEIQNLVGETNKNIEQLSGSLDGIDKDIEHLIHTMEGNSDSQGRQEKVNEIASGLKGLFNKLTSNAVQLNEDLIELQNENKRLDHELHSAINGITVGNDFDLGLQQAINGLDAIITQITRTYGTVNQKAVSELLQAHRERYTMDTEREVHDVFTGTGTTVNTDNEMGDNVELF